MKKIILLMLLTIGSWYHSFAQVSNEPGSSNFTVSATTICSGLPVTFTGTTACSSITQSLNFAGTGTASTSRVLTADNNLTIEGWIKPNSANGTTSLFYNNGFGLILRGTQISGIVPGRAFLDSNANVTVGIWQHVALVRNAGTWAIYLNGTAYTTYATNTNPNNQNRGTFIGCNLNNGEIFDGAISQVAFWNTVRTTSQIQGDMQACSFSGSGLAAYWSLNGNGNDLSGNGHNLNLSNTTYRVDAPPLPPTSGAQYVFDFGDGSTYTSNVGTTIHVYPTASTYTASLSVTYNGSTSTSTNNILVNPTPIVSISGPSVACGSATLTASGGTSYAWTSGSSTNTAETTITTTSTPTVTVSNICGCSATASQAVTITPVTVAGTISENQTITSPTGSGTSLITVDQNLNGGSWISISSDYYPYPEYDPTWFYPGSNEAQSFKASISTLWTSLKINVQAINQPGDVTLQIFSGDGVSGTSLLFQTLSISTNGINTFTFSSPISVTAGQFYTFKFSSNGSAYLYIDYSNTTSPLGTLYQNGNSINGALYFENTYEIDNANWDNLTLTENTGNVLYWQQSADVGFSNPTTLANTSTTLYSGTVGSLNATTYFRAIVQNGNCDILNTNTVTISSGNTINSTTVSSCGSYTWTNNNVTYTETGVYTGTTTNGITEQLDLTITTPPSTFTSDGLNYTVTSSTSVAVGNNSGASGSVVIPASITTSCGTFNVTSISNYAFYNNYDLNSVIIPNSVSSIGEFAFGNCTSLTSVICNVTSPIEISPNVFENINQAACSLAVPNGSVIAYQAAAVWKNFAPIFSYSKIIDSQCGATLSALNTLIRANAITGASHYRFKVVNGTTTQIIEPTSGRWFRLTSLPGGTFYNTAYTISVAVKKNNVWGGYGEECTVTTPAFPNTKVRDSQCGFTLASITTFISADVVNAASGYRFKVVNGASTEIIEAVSGSRWFRLTSLSGGASYNTTYTISAASKYNGVWSNYGVECAVTTPSVPLTKLTGRQCGMTLASGNATVLYATAVSVAQKYRFEVSLGADVYTYDTASSSVRNFRMTNVPGLTLTSGTTYAVRVAIMLNDAWQPYGESCNITTFGVAPNFVKTMNVETTDFNVVSYPNPFTENFNLNLTSLSEEKVTVMVYDMTGKLLDRKEVVPSELSELQIGNNFASGIYNVIVSQGTNTKSLRVIKK